MAQNETLVKQSKTIRDLLTRPDILEQLNNALPKHITAERFSRVALTTIMQNDNLLNCDTGSIMKSLIQSAALGLEIDGTLGHAYLIPYGGKATFQVGYKGLIALARRSGEIKSFCAQVVYSEDGFEFEYGTSEKLSHKPAKGDRGDMVGAYAIVHYKDGGYSFDYMSKIDIDKVRKRSKASSSGPWVTDYDEMARKTVAKRLAKYLPLSVEFQQAAQLDEHYDLGLDEPAKSQAQEVMDRFKTAKDVTDDIPEFITTDKIEILKATLKEKKKNLTEMLEWGEKQRIEDINVSEYPEFVAWIEKS